MYYPEKAFSRAALIAASIILITLPLTLAACGGSSDTTTSPETVTANTAQDRAARLAAESQLRNAQMAQEQYFAENERYASTTSELSSIDQSSGSRVEVVRGDARGYEIQITANDSGKTVLIVRKTGTRIERVDGNGDPW
jgi:uncharacterized membrane protein YdfJ with MMPL/SSD domain